MNVKRWSVTKKAGPQVAGRTVKPGQVLELTDHEARAEVIVGALEPAPETGAVSEPGETASKPVRKASAKAAAPEGGTS